MGETVLKKSICLFVILLFASFMVSSLPVLAQENETADPCADVVCSDLALTCPDGFAASCSNACDPGTGACSSCTPDCTGHEAPVCGDGTCDVDESPETCPGDCGQPVTCPTPPEPLICPESSDLVEDYDDQGCLTGYRCEGPFIYPEICPPAPDPFPCPEDEKLIEDYDEQNCITGYHCKPYEGPVECPTEPEPIQCGPDENQIRDVDRQGCTIGYHCEGIIIQPCPNIYIEPPECGPDERLIADHDTNGCLKGYHCKYEGGPGECPDWMPSEPMCGQDGYPVADFDINKCLIGWHCEYTAPPQPPDPEPYGCPVNDVCPDGFTKPCRWEGPETGEGRCICDACPPPQGCQEVRDPETGYVHTTCGTQPGECPEIPKEEWDKCMAKGGRPELRKDNMNCEFISCEFGGNEPQFYQNWEECPSEEEMNRVKEECRNMGMEDRVVREGGCYFVKCMPKGQEPWGSECPAVSFEQKEAVFTRCESMGQAVTEAWDERGCMHLRCADEGECMRLPPDAFRKCEEGGGELIARDDENGCVVWHECVMRGNAENVFYERPERMPETTELLEIAFKLESLRIELDRLARKSDDIADYYASTGSSDEEKFRRVADMFDSAKGTVDDVKTKIRDRLDHITLDDIMEIKHDINYIKDVIIKDILYVMLSTGEEIVERIEGGTEGSCGTNGMCFDNALRVCEPVEFMPEGYQGPTMNIVGLEGDACVMNVRLPEGMGPPGVGAVEMTCRIRNYAMGIRDPEQDLIPFCEGTMKDMIDQYGMGPGGPGGPGPEGPGEMFRMCSPEDERAMKECGNRGGAPQSDPTPQGCEVYTGCETFEPAGPGPGGYQEPYQPGPTSGGGGGGGVMPCSGCLDNGICDPGECSDCFDCGGGGY